MYQRYSCYAVYLVAADQRAKCSQRFTNVWLVYADDTPRATDSNLPPWNALNNTKTPKIYQFDISFNRLFIRDTDRIPFDENYNKKKRKR